MPIAAATHQIVQSLVGYGYGEQDFAALIELQARASGLELVSENAAVHDGLEPDGREHLPPVPRQGLAPLSPENEDQPRVLGTTN
jgi:hypothetical protein